MTAISTPGPELLDAAIGRQGETVELRRAIHAEPELGLDLPDTQAKILESLTGLGMNITTGTATTSVVADLDSGRPGPTVLLRADMDALPMQEDNDTGFQSIHEGRMHACGHDAHVSMLVTAARLIADNKGELTGKIRFMFQPGEEGHAGAQVMLDEGLLDGGVDRAFAIHIISNMPRGALLSRGGALMASADTFNITVHGKGGHASMPHGCVDPIPTAAATVTGLQTMVGRNMNANDPSVVTVAHIEAGSTNNVIPETAWMEGTIRALSERTRSDLHAGIVRVAESTAAAHGCSCTAEIEPGYPVTINDQGQVDLADAVATDVFGEGAFIQMPTPIMGAEDWSYVLQKVPGSMAFLGACPVGEDPRTTAPNHSNYMRIDEDSMDRGAAMYAAMALARPA